MGWGELMQWKAFYAAWLERIGINMPKESLPAWSAYVSGLPDDTALQALESITELYFAQRQRNGEFTPPTLWQFRKAVAEVFMQNKPPQQDNRCRLCDGEGLVIVLDRVDGREFPPDPADDLPRRSICAIPCPDCRGEEYLNPRLRELVRARCRSNRRRDELMQRPQP